MRSFDLRLLGARESEVLRGVTSFVGEDPTGSFGILAGHARMIASLTTGLARFRVEEGRWHYLALPGAVLYFANDVLTVSTSQYLIDDDYTRVSEALRRQLEAEEEQVRALRASLHRMEEEVYKRLWEIGRRGG